MANIFICYNHKDRGFAELLERLLTIEGHNVYSDANLKAGEVWHLRLEKAIRQADVMIGGVRDITNCTKNDIEYLLFFLKNRFFFEEEREA